MLGVVWLWYIHTYIHTHTRTLHDQNIEPTVTVGNYLVVRLHVVEQWSSKIQPTFPRSKLGTHAFSQRKPHILICYIQLLTFLMVAWSVVVLVCYSKVHRHCRHNLPFLEHPQVAGSSRVRTFLLVSSQYEDCLHTKPNSPCPWLNRWNPQASCTIHLASVVLPRNGLSSLAATVHHCCFTSIPPQPSGYVLWCAQTTNGKRPAKHIHWQSIPQLSHVPNWPFYSEE